jgi:predicted transcriptional regulator
VREFGQLESAIMDVIWAGSRPYGVREVRERMTYGRPVAYTTVMTVLGILYGKGVLHRESTAARGGTGRPKPGKSTTRG